MTKILIKLMALILLGLSVVSCSKESPPNKVESRQTLDLVDPCKLLHKEELQEFGINSDSKPYEFIDEKGCDWDGAPKSITLSKGIQGLDFFDRRASWHIKYLRNMINNRPGALMQGSPTNTECSQVLAVGTGDVVVTMFYFRPTGADTNYQYPPDPCSDALAIATIIEPRLPK